MQYLLSIKSSFLVLLIFFSSLIDFSPVIHHDYDGMAVSLSAQIFLPMLSNDCGNCFYLDSVSGSDSNSGTSIDEPWQTLAPLHLTNLLPGSIVNFKRGSHWEGGLAIYDSGVQDKPILFTAYGDGDRPTFSNPGNGTEWTSGIMIYADWIKLEGLKVHDVHDAGVYIADGSDYNSVSDVEVTDAGIGISVLGRHNIVTRNYLHDLKMINNTPGGTEDDYGAVGIWLGNSYNEISYNRIVNCIAPSYDFGTDGGAIEWYGFADGNFVHHNWASGNKGFLEVGVGSAKDNVVAYNLSVNNGRFSIIHLDGSFQSDVRNFRFENNTIVEAMHNEPGWVIFGFGGDPRLDTFILQNNIVYADNFQAISNKSNFTHSHNLFFLNNVPELGFPLDPSEIQSDPLFVDLANENYRLKQGSPAIDRGLELGHTLDFENQPVFWGQAPDLGAYEYP